MVKMVAVRISMNLDANVRIKVNDAVVKQVDRFVYLGNELYPERKTDNRSIEQCEKLVNKVRRELARVACSCKKHV
jgi:hypothetical protein